MKERVAASGSRGPIAVVGAGIIGTAIAFELQRRGEQVRLLERDAPGKGASYGNLASIAVTEFLPASRPGVWKRLPKWAFEREGPIHIRPSYLPRLGPWLLRFLQAGRPAKLRALEAAGATLSRRALADFELMLARAGLSHMVGSCGCLSLYADEDEFRADHDHLEALARFEFKHELLDGAAARRLEPALARKIDKAVLLPDNRSVTDPYNLVLALLARFEVLGGAIQRADVIGFEHTDGHVCALRLSGGTTLPADRIVLAAGAQTGRLSRLLNEPIPLESERGYHTQIMAPAISLRHSVIWPARAFMVTPTAGGIRVGGSVEMAGLDAAPDFRRAKAMVRRAKEVLPDLQAQEATEWMGHRPALPDTVPLIGPSAKHRGIFYATGHGHLGLTYSGTTARLIADLATGATPPIDLTPYRVDRF